MLYSVTHTLSRITLSTIIAVIFLVSAFPQLVSAQTTRPPLTFGPDVGSVPRDPFVGGTELGFGPNVPSVGNPGFPGSNVPVSGAIDPATGESVIYNETGNAVGTQQVIQTTDPITTLNGVNAFLYGVMIGIGGVVAWFGGLLLDTSIDHFILQMGQKLSNENFGYVVNSIWTVVRDLFNILFIFALIYIGLKTILFSDDSSVKRDLGYLIIAALLINFSLLFTKMIVDFSNIAAIEIYETFEGIQGTGANQALSYYVTGETGGSRSVNVSNVFMERLNLSSYANTEQLRVTLGDGSESGIHWKVLTFGFVAMLMMIIAGFVFAAGAVLIFYRFVVLIIMMMFSPVMFIGWIWPKLLGKQNEWWNKFLKNAFVAPAYLFMLYICARLFEGFDYTRIGYGYAFDNTGQSFVVYTYFFIMIFFLIAATRVASIMGAAGADVTARIGNSGLRFATTTMGGAVFGGAAVAGRNTAGWAAQRFGVDNEKLKEASSRGGLRGIAARSTLKASRAIADSSFDARQNVKGLRSTNIPFVGDVSFGEGRKGGYTSILKESSKKEKEFAESLGERKQESVDEKVTASKLALAQAQLNNKKLELTNELIAPRTAIKTLRGQMRTARGAMEKARIQAEIDSHQAEIVDIKDQFAPILETAQAAVESAKKTQQVAKYDREKTRQTQYAQYIGNKGFVSNALALKTMYQANNDAQTILKEVKKGREKLSKDSTQNTLDELMKKVEGLSEKK